MEVQLEEKLAALQGAAPDAGAATGADAAKTDELKAEGEVIAYSAPVPPDWRACMRSAGRI
jgi:hypothetical protein